MNHNEELKQLEIIEDYCTNAMPPEERRIFEDKLLVDSSLVKCVDDYKRTVRLLENLAQERRILTIIQKVKLQSHKEHTQKSWWVYVGAMAAACIVLILYASLSLVQLPNSENDLTVLRDLDVATLSSEDKKNVEQFYAGQAALTMGQFDQAVHYFELVLKKQPLRPYFQQATEWHLVLAYLYNKQITEAKTLLEHINEEKVEVYPVGFMNKFKLWWQLLWASFEAKS